MNADANETIANKHNNLFLALCLSESFREWVLASNTKRGF